jgi:type VI secretion system protein
MNKRVIFFRKRVLRLCFILGMIDLVSCSSVTDPELSMKSVSIFVEPDANQNSATAVDLVLVYNEELVKTIGKMSAAKYFESSSQLLLDNPTLLDVWHWELVPGQIVEDFEPPQEKGDAFGGFVFANYLTPGDHRVKVAPNGIVKILLLKNDLKNLATYDIRDVKNGTTMTDVVNPKELSETGDYPFKVRRGPTKENDITCRRGVRKESLTENVLPPCPPGKRMLPPCPLAQSIPPCPSGQAIPPCPPGVVGTPIPITVQPLGPTSGMTVPSGPLKLRPSQSRVRTKMVSSVNAGNDAIEINQIDLCPRNMTK